MRGSLPFNRHSQDMRQQIGGGDHLRSGLVIVMKNLNLLLSQICDNFLDTYSTFASSPSSPSLSGTSFSANVMETFITSISYGRCYGPAGRTSITSYIA